MVKRSNTKVKIEPMHGKIFIVKISYLKFFKIGSYFDRGFSILFEKELQKTRK